MNLNIYHTASRVITYQVFKFYALTRKSMQIFAYHVVSVTADHIGSMKEPLLYANLQQYTNPATQKCICDTNQVEFVIMPT